MTVDAIRSHLGKELFVSLLTTEETDYEHTRSINRKQGTDAVELATEYFEHDEGKGELGQGSANVGAFKGTLGCANFDNLIGGQRNGTSAVQAEVISISSATL